MKIGKIINTVSKARMGTYIYGAELLPSGSAQRAPVTVGLTPGGSAPSVGRPKGLFPLWTLSLALWPNFRSEL